MMSPSPREPDIRTLGSLRRGFVGLCRRLWFYGRRRRQLVDHLALENQKSHPLQFGENFRCRLVSKRSVFLETLRNEALEFRVYSLQFRRLSIEHAVEDHSGSAPGERQRAGCHFVEDDAERKQIRP